MKKFLLAAVLVLASTSAMADRTVSGEANMPDKGSACESAKQKASLKINSFSEVVESYSKCDCEKTKGDRWSCSVDALLVVEKKN